MCFGTQCHVDGQYYILAKLHFSLICDLSGLHLTIRIDDVEQGELMQIDNWLKLVSIISCKSSSNG